MKYLLDSHTFLWTLERPQKLSGRARTIIEDPGSRLLLSMATPWELAIKSNLGMLDARKILEQFDQVISSGGYEILDTKVTHAVQAGLLPLHHRDPFDRLLAAQALDLRVPILSRNRVFDSYGVRRIWD